MTVGRPSSATWNGRKCEVRTSSFGQLRVAEVGATFGPLKGYPHSRPRRGDYEWCVGSDFVSWDFDPPGDLPANRFRFGHRVRPVADLTRLSLVKPDHQRTLINILAQSYGNIYKINMLRNKTRRMSKIWPICMLPHSRRPTLTPAGACATAAIPG